MSVLVRRQLRRGHAGTGVARVDLDLVLRRLGVKSVVLAGVQTPNCIRATAADATSLDYHCIVLSDATASASDEIQNANLYDMSMMGVSVMTVEEAAEKLLVTV